MPTCPRCKYHFRTLEDEDELFSCPKCGYFQDDDSYDLEVEPEVESELDKVIQDMYYQEWLERNKQ